MKIDLQPLHLENDLVRLLPLSEDHFSILYAAAADPKIWEQHPESDRWKKEVFEKYFRSAIESRGAFLIMDSRSGEVAGSSRYYGWNEQEKSIRIGYTFITRQYWGGPFNRSLKELMIGHAFTFAVAVYFDIGVNNLRSRKAVEKLGAEQVNCADPEKCIYVLKKEDWKV